MNKINYKVIFLILFISILLGFIYNTFSSDGIDFIREPILVKSVLIGEESNISDQLRGIDLSQAIELYNNNSALFIDARDQWEYSENHISNAINIPEFSFEPNNQLLNTIDKNNLIVIYCDGDDCDLSKRLTKQLVDLGYTNCYVFLDGFNSWKEAKLPTEKGNRNE
jgi:rhodanese-related sulfurtransferase